MLRDVAGTLTLGATGRASLDFAVAAWSTEVLGLGVHSGDGCCASPTKFTHISDVITSTGLWSDQGKI